MNLVEWWNEPSLAIDAGGTLYAAWDTQGQAWDGDPADTGWLSYSTDGGAIWSTPVQGPTDTSNVPHIMEVTGGAAGQADVAWLSDSNPQGYALYLRPFSVADGWTAPGHRISKLFGSPDVWPGDTFGLSALSPTRLVVSWGSAVPSDDTDSAIFGAAVNLTSGK